LKRARRLIAASSLQNDREALIKANRGSEKKKDGPTATKKTKRKDSPVGESWNLEGETFPKGIGGRREKPRKY